MEGPVAARRVINAGGRIQAVIFHPRLSGAGRWGGGRAKEEEEEMEEGGLIRHLTGAGEEDEGDEEEEEEEGGINLPLVWGDMLAG